MATTFLSAAGPRFGAILIAAAAVLTLGGVGGCGDQGKSRAGGDGYEKLDLALQPLRRDFESYFGQIRVVVVVAPTCGACIETTERIEAAVRPWAEANDAEIFVVWGSVTPTDTEIRCAERVKGMSSPRYHHYFDESGRSTRAFGRMLGLANNRDAYDVVFAYGPEATWDPNGTMDDEPRDFSVALSLWEPTRPDVAALSGSIDRVLLPEFTAAELVRILDDYVAERAGR